MVYEQALAYLHSLHRFGSHLGLSRIERLLDRMGNPHHAWHAVHVAGTNGKGSVTAMLASILTEAGYRTGRYISPYLEQFSERIRLNHQDIDPDTLVRLVSDLARCIDRWFAAAEHPTEFEAVTALAFEFFRQQKADIVALEVGLGGRYDATNVVNGRVNVITNIGWDHMQQLGDTLEKIAFEKAGIIKPHSTVVTGAQGEAFDVVAKVSRQLQVPVARIGEQITWQEVESSMEGQVIHVHTVARQYEGLFVPLLGRHQQENAALAVAAAEALSQRGFPVSEEAMRQGLLKTQWPGRLEVLGTEPTVLIDGAHNVEGARALAAALGDIISYRRLILVLGVLEDKQVDPLLDELIPLCSEVITTLPDSPRALAPEVLAKAIEKRGCPVTVERDVYRAVTMARQRAHAEDCVCVAGSLYLIGRVRSFLRTGIYLA